MVERDTLQVDIPTKDQQVEGETNPDKILDDVFLDQAIGWGSAAATAPAAYLAKLAVKGNLRSRGFNNVSTVAEGVVPALNANIEEMTQAGVTPIEQVMVAGANVDPLNPSQRIIARPDLTVGELGKGATWTYATGKLGNELLTGSMADRVNVLTGASDTYLLFGATDGVDALPSSVKDRVILPGSTGLAE